MSRAHRLTIVLTPSTLSAMLCDANARLIGHARQLIDPATQSVGSSLQLDDLDETLRGMLATLGVKPRTQTSIVYLGSDEVIDARQFEPGVRNAGALATAKLLNDLAFDRETAISAAAAPHLPNLGHHNLIIAAADRDAHVASLFTWLRRCGLEPVSATPLEALEIGAALASVQVPTARSQDAAAESTSRVEWWLGEFVSVLVGVSQSSDGSPRIELVRAVRLGFEALTEAMARALDDGQDPEHTHSTNTERARSILLKIGIPAQDQMVDSITGKTGFDVLPLMQPVLQRMALEVKQTLRYGLSNTTCDSIVVRGPGAHIDGIGPFLDQFVGCDIQVPEHREHDAGPESMSEKWLSHRAPGRVELIPTSVQHRRTSDGLSRALRVGGVAALFMLSLAAVDAWQTHTQISRQIEAFSPQIDQARRITEAETSAQQLAMRVAHLESQVVTAVGETPAWRGVLVEVASLAADRVELLALSTRATPNGQSALEIRGMLPNLPEDAAESPLTLFIADLSASPLLTDVRLKSTRVTEVDGKSRSQFVVEATCQSVPTEHVLLASKREGDS